MTNHTQFELHGDTAIITMDDGKANAFGFDMMKSISQAFDRAKDEAASVVLTGRAGVLCAGFDLKLMKTEPERVSEMVATGARLLSQIFVHPQPVVIAASGHAMAAGGLLVLTGDYRVGSAGDFKIGLNETAIGMVMPDFGVDLARLRLGEHNLTEAVLCAHLYDPESAVSVGYLDEVSAPEKLLDTAIAKAKALEGLDLRAYAGSKSKLRRPHADKLLAGLKHDNLNIAKSA